MKKLFYHDAREFKTELHAWIKRFEASSADLTEFVPWFQEASVAARFSNPDRLLHHLRWLITSKNWDRAHKLISAIPSWSARLWFALFALCVWHLTRLAAVVAVVLLVLWLTGVWS